VFTGGQPGDGDAWSDMRTRVFIDTPYQVVIRRCGTCGKGEVVTGRGFLPQLFPDSAEGAGGDRRTT